MNETRKRKSCKPHWATPQGPHQLDKFFRQTQNSPCPECNSRKPWTRGPSPWVSSSYEPARVRICFHGGWSRWRDQAEQRKRWRPLSGRCACRIQRVVWYRLPKDQGLARRCPRLLPLPSQDQACAPALPKTAWTAKEY